MIREQAEISFTEHWERKTDRADHYDLPGIALSSPAAQNGIARKDGRRPALAAAAYFPTGITQRLQGPGGYYNIGNAIGLTSGLIFQMAASHKAATSGETGAATIVGSYLFGSPSATALTLATAIFFASGELYHRAWRAAGEEPDRKRLFQADLMSGVGAVCLAIALLLLGSVWLALASTALLAGGKFGNALTPARALPVTVYSKTFDAFRLAPALSRVPAMVALAAVIGWSAVTASIDPSQLLQTGILLSCYCLWFRADLLLLRA